MPGEENNNDPDSIANKPPVPPRDDLVQRAADFLSMRNVQKSPDDMKVAFLKKKGLSDVEIDLAFKKCELTLQNKAFDLSSGPPERPPYPYYQQQLVNPYQRRWSALRDLVNGIIFIAGALYGLYWFYKKYVWRYIFGDRRAKRPSTEERLSEMENKLSMICQNLDTLKEAVENKSSFIREIQEVKFEVSSLKKLLLSRKQFPIATASAPLSIPSWQIASTTEEKEEEGAATNGSDSSLEMIKE